ncbi:hypothetical protein AGMMS49975_23360 [Clostridia bacterium]|nr:hypothetical protein AGMMS49975_23360 [Clostridia bacterium]
MEDITVVVAKPKEQPEVRKVANTLEAFQKLVGGYIETLTDISNPDHLVVINEERRIIGLSYNRNVFGYSVVGPIVAVARTDDEFSSLTETEVEYYMNLFRLR